MRTDLCQNRIRLYIPFGNPTYSYFYMMKLDDEITADEVLRHVLNHMKVQYSLVKKTHIASYFDETSSLSSSISPEEDYQLIVDPAQFSIALKISPSSYKTEKSATGCRMNEYLKVEQGIEILQHYSHTTYQK